MRNQVIFFSLSLITAGILYAAAVPIEAPEDFSSLEGRPDNALAIIASHLSDPDLARFSEFNRRFHRIAQAEFETRASWLWKTGNGELKPPTTFHAHQGPVRAVFITNDGKIVSVGADHQIYVWQWDNETKTYIQIKQMTDVNVVPGQVEVLFSLASNRLVTYNSDTTRITVWDVKTGKELNHYNRANLYKPYISPDGAILAIGNKNDDNIYLLNTISGELIKQINTDYSLISSMAFSPDGKKLAASAGRNKPVKVWNLKDYKESTSPLNKDFLSLSFLADGRLIAYNAAYQGEIKKISVWDVQTGHQISSISNLPMLAYLKVSHNGIVAVYYESNINLYYLQSGLSLRELNSTNNVMDLAFSPDDKMLVAGCVNGDIITWTIQHKKEEVKSKK